MHLDSGVNRAERGGSQVFHTRRSAAYQRDFSIEYRRVFDGAADDVTDRDIGETAGRSTERHQHRALGIDRDAVAGQFQGLERRVITDPGRGVDEYRQGDVVQERRGGGERQGLVNAQLVLVQQRRAAHNAVRVDQRVVDEAGREGRFHQHRQGRGVALASRKENAVHHRPVQIKRRVWQLPGLERRFLVGIEVKTQDGRPILHGIGKQPVAVQQRLEPVEFFTKCLVAFLFRQAPQQTHIRAFIPLGEQHVKHYHGGAVTPQVVHHVGKFLARERPVPMAFQAGLVDGHDHDTVVDAALGGQPHPGVIQQIFDLVDVRDFVIPGNVAQHAQHRDQAQAHTHQVTQPDASHRGFLTIIEPRMRSFRSSQSMLDDLSIRSASTLFGQG